MASGQDAELSEEGHLFALKLGAFLKRRTREYHGDKIPRKPLRVMSSTMPACVQTCLSAVSSVSFLESQAFKQTPSLNPIDRGRLGGSWWVDECGDKPAWHW